MAEQHVTLRVGQKGAGGVSAAAKKVERSWLDTAAKLAIVGQVATRAFGAIARSMAEPMKAAAKFAKDSAQLDVALSRLGQDVDKTRASFDSFASEMQRTAGVSMDTVTSMQRLWVQLTGNADGANKATEAAMELNAVLGIDANSAMRMLSQAAEGNVQTLARYVPAVRNLTQEQIKAGKAIDLVAEKFGGALAANMKTVSGQWERLNNIIMDRYKEASALAIIQSEKLTVGFSVLGDELIAMAPSGEEVNEALEVMADTLAGMLPSLITIGTVGVVTMLDLADAALAVTGAIAKVKGAAFDLTKLIPAMAIADKILGVDRETFQRSAENIDGMREKLAKMREGAEDVGVKMHAAMERVAAAVRAASGRTERLKAATDDAANSIKKLVAVTQEAAVQEGLIFTRLEDYKQSVLASNRAEYARLGEESAAAAAEAHEEYVARVIKAEELSRAAQEQTRAAIRRGAAAMMSGAETLGAAMFAVADGAMTAAEAARHLAVTAANAMIDSVLAVVQAKLVEAMVSAMAGHSGIPFVGYAIGAAAAATMAGAIKALISKIERPRGFYFGGTVTGGIPGRDSVPAMLRPDERVLTPHQAEQQASIAAMAGGGSTLQVVVNAPLGMGDSVAVMRQYERAWLPALERMARTGRLDRVLAMAGAR